jgi:hypothetical protein
VTVSVSVRLLCKNVNSNFYTIIVFLFPIVLATSVCSFLMKQCLSFVTVHCSVFFLFWSRCVAFLHLIISKNLVFQLYHNKQCPLCNTVEFHNMCILASLSQHQLNFPKINTKNLITTVPKFNFVTFIISFFFTTVPFI